MSTNSGSASTKPSLDQGYPEQHHAGKVGYGPNYRQGATLGDKIAGLSEEIRGKITHRPDLVKEGHDKKTGEVRKRKVLGHDEKNPFEGVDSESDGSKPTQSPAASHTSSSNSHHEQPIPHRASEGDPTKRNLTGRDSTYPTERDATKKNSTGANSTERDSTDSTDRDSTKTEKDSAERDSADNDSAKRNSTDLTERNATKRNATKRNSTEKDSVERDSADGNSAESMSTRAYTSGSGAKEQAATVAPQGTSSATSQARGEATEKMTQIDEEPR